MLTKTALRSPAYLARIKAAVVAAVKHAKPVRYGVSIAGPRGIGRSVVNDRRGRSSIWVVFYSGHGPEFFDRENRNVTDSVLTALRTWHAETRIPRMEVREASSEEWTEACQAGA